MYNVRLSTYLYRYFYYYFVSCARTTRDLRRYNNYSKYVDCSKTKEAEMTRYPNNSNNNNYCDMRVFVIFTYRCLIRDEVETPNKSTGVVAQIKSIRRRLRRVCRSGIYKYLQVLYYCICTRCYCTRLIYAFTFIAFFHDLWFFGSPAAAYLYT